MRGNREIDFRGELCIYCRTNYSTRQGDHVPPEQMFPEGVEQVQVPCCEKCNNSFSHFDEIMRNKLAYLSEYAPNELRERAYGALKDHPAKYLQLETSSLRDNEGEQRTIINFYNDRETLDRWFERIIRGLVFHRSGAHLPSSFLFKTTLNFDRLEPPPGVVSFFDQDFDELVSVDPRSPYFFSELFVGEEAEKFFEETSCRIWTTVFYRRIFFTTLIRSN